MHNVDYSRFALVIVVMLFVAAGCSAKTSSEPVVAGSRGALRFVMNVEDVKTRTISKNNSTGSGACLIFGTITNVKNKQPVKNTKYSLIEDWQNYFDEGETITVVAPCKDKYYVEQTGVVSLIKSSVKLAKTMEFWGNDLRDARYEGCERFGECGLEGRFIFSPVGAMILETHE